MLQWMPTNHCMWSTTLGATKKLKLKKKKIKRFYQKYLELRRRINAHSYPVLPATINTGIISVNTTHTIAPTTSATTTTNNFTVQRSASLKDYKPLRYELIYLTYWKTIVSTFVYFFVVSDILKLHLSSHLLWFVLVYSWFKFDLLEIIDSLFEAASNFQSMWFNEIGSNHNVVDLMEDWAEK